MTAGGMAFYRKPHNRVCEEVSRNSRGLGSWELPHGTLYSLNGCAVAMPVIATQHQ